MSFDLTQSSDTSKIVEYNYYPTTFYKNQYQSRLKNNGYIQIPYTSKPNTPNISFLENGYVTKSLHIVEKIHTINDVDYDASLVIEHTSLTNSSVPLYTCFLLQTQNIEENDLDNLIEGVTDTDIALNDYISDGDVIVYDNPYSLNRCKVIIFTTPIAVATKFTHMKPGTFSIAPYVSQYSIIGTSSSLGDAVPMIEGFREGATDVTSMAGYCTPIDENDPSIGEMAAYELPPDNPYTKNTAIDASIKTILNFIGFFMLILFGAFAVPAVHKNLLFDLVMDNDTFSPQRKFDRLRAVEMFTFVIFFGFAISFINNGILNSNSNSTITGLYIFIFFIEAFIILQYNRISDQNKFLDSFGKPQPIADNSSPDIIGFLKDNILGLMFKKTMVPDPEDSTKKIPKMDFQFTFIGVGLIYTGLFFLLKHLNLDAGHNMILSIPFYAFFLSMYLMILFNHYWYVYTKNL